MRAALLALFAYSFTFVVPFYPSCPYLECGPARRSRATGPAIPLVSAAYRVASAVFDALSSTLWWGCGGVGLLGCGAVGRSGGGAGAPERLPGYATKKAAPSPSRLLSREQEKEARGRKLAAGSSRPAETKSRSSMKYSGALVLGAAFPVGLGAGRAERAGSLRRALSWALSLFGALSLGRSLASALSLVPRARPPQ